MSRPHQERCEGDGCLVGLGGLVVAGRDAAPLLEAVEAPFHDVATLVELLVEGRRAPASAAAPEPVADLVGPLGNGVSDAVPPQPGAYRAGAVALVAQHMRGPRTRGRPGPRRGTRIASITVVNWVQSLVLPPVSTKASRRPKASQAR